MTSLADKVVLITGGAGGIGSATAAELIGRGALPVLADRDDAALERAAAALGGDVFTTTVDVTDRASCETAVEATLDRHGRIDTVWANAGISAYGPLELFDADAWEAIVRVNLIGAYNTVRAALPAVIASRGYVVVTCSLASFSHQPGMSAYAASKSGAEAMANSLRLEVAHQGVAVGTLHPSWISTPMVTEREREPAYQRLRAALRPPFNATTPVEAIVPDIVAGFERRSQRIVTPRSGWAAHALRSVLTTRFFTRDVRRAAPDIRRLYAEQIRGSDRESR